MSQATQSLPLKHQLSAHRILAVSALLALLATTAVVLVLTIDGGSTAASAGARTSAGPDESSIAAAIGSASDASPKVGEIKVSPSIRH